MNDENLRPSEYKLSQEEAKRGGIASGKARRQKADLRRAMQEALNSTFTDSKGKKATGQEIVMAGLIANLSDPKARNWGKAVEVMLLLTGQNMTKEQIAKLKAETELTKAKTKAIQQDGGSLADIEDLSPLANLLRGETNDEDSND
jgi:hypothetical protein